jgi:hypothetical protein
MIFYSPQIFCRQRFVPWRTDNNRNAIFMLDAHTGTCPLARLKSLRMGTRKAQLFFQHPSLHSSPRLHFGHSNTIAYKLLILTNTACSYFKNNIDMFFFQTQTQSHYT